MLFQVVSLSSSRNMAIIGLAVILGIMIPTWVGKVENPFNTGTIMFNKVTFLHMRFKYTDASSVHPFVCRMSAIFEALS